jgi:hypothetical protein
MCLWCPVTADASDTSFTNDSVDKKQLNCPFGATNKKSITSLVDKDKFDKAVAYAISKGYFRDPGTPDNNQSTDEGGLVTLRTPSVAKVAAFQTDGDTFDGLGNLSTQTAETNSSYTCPKCGSTGNETGQIRVSGDFWSGVLDVAN